MPVYHFTFHAYGSWLPNKAAGYYRHDAGWHPPNKDTAARYRSQMGGSAVRFNTKQQQLLLDELIKAQAYQRIELYAAALDPVHVHTVVAWRDKRDVVQIRRQVKTSLTKAMNTRFGRQQWFVAKAGQSQVRDDEHLSDLVHQYLPKHTLHWFNKPSGQDER